MGIMFNGITLASGLTLVAFIGVWLFLNEVARRSKKLSLLMFVALPVVLAALVGMGVLGSPSGKTWFAWVKVVSALAGVYGFMTIRFTKLEKTKFAMYFPVTILALNIAEAVYKELEVFATYKTLSLDPGGSMILGGTWNLLNATSGVICIVTLVGFMGIKVSQDKTRDMIWPDMTWLYIIGYTLWNFAYVYNCISTRSMYAGFGILVAALIAEFFFKQGAWLQHRAQILSLYAMFSLTVDFQSYQVFRILPTYEPTGLMVLSSVALLFNLYVLVVIGSHALKGRKNPLKEEILGATAYYQRTLSTNNL